MLKEGQSNLACISSSTQYFNSLLTEQNWNKKEERVGMKKKKEHKVEKPKDKNNTSEVSVTGP